MLVLSVDRKEKYMALFYRERNWKWESKLIVIREYFFIEEFGWLIKINIRSSTETNEKTKKQEPYTSIEIATRFIFSSSTNLIKKDSVTIEWTRFLFIIHSNQREIHLFHDFCQHVEQSWDRTMPSLFFI